jgi:alkyldihydroxyacetonephosphate synthase
MRWWGWGEDGHDVNLPEDATFLLETQLGIARGERRSPVALEEVRLPEPRLPAALRERLTGLLGAEHVRDDRAARVEHALGRSYPDLIRLRSGDGSSAPDLVVHPGSADEVAAVLAACAEPACPRARSRHWGC